MKTNITKAMILKTIEGYFTAEGYSADEVIGMSNEASVTAGDIVAYCEKTLEQLEAKSAKAKVYAAKRKGDSAEFKARVAGFLTDEFQTREEILAKFEGEEDVTIAKVGARLSQLVKDGTAVKESEKNALGKVKVRYKLA